MTFGCMGANMQPQGQVQILLNAIDRGMNPQEAIDASRVVLGGNRISVESTFPSDIIARLASAGRLTIIAGEEPPAVVAPA
jgi:gamma-glutamyltranspeptidase/glutathione hydrolase